MKLPLALAPFVALLVACSSAPTSSTSSNDEAIKKKAPQAMEGCGSSSGSGSGSGSSGGGGAFSTTHSTWYCGDACGMNDTGSCGTTYCGSQVDPTVLGAALSITRMNGPSGVWKGGGLCGTQIEIVALDTGKSITVPVIDACEACNADDHVDLTLATWQALGEDPCKGVFDQKWRFVD